MENKIKIDLHIHTNKSDGNYTNKEVIDKAKKNGVKIMAIADHDTIEAYSDDIIAYAKNQGITLIPAVEISTKINKCGIHILGYNIDLNSDILKQQLYKLRNARHNYLFNVAKKLNELGYIINLQELDNIEAVTKSHIATDLINNKQNEKLLLSTFNHIPTKGEFIENIMNEGCIAYTKKDTITPIDAANLIRSVGGIPVLAHPVAYKHEDNLTDAEILNVIKETNINTIEAGYVYVDKNGVKFNEFDHWLKFAKDNNLHYTIGSDFHYEDGIRPTIGLTNDLEYTNNQVVQVINTLNISTSLITNKN